MRPYYTWGTWVYRIYRGQAWMWISGTKRWSPYTEQAKDFRVPRHPGAVRHCSLSITLLRHEVDV